MHNVHNSVTPTQYPYPFCILKLLVKYNWIYYGKTAVTKKKKKKKKKRKKEKIKKNSLTEGPKEENKRWQKQNGTVVVKDIVT